MKNKVIKLFIRLLINIVVFLVIILLTIYGIKYFGETFYIALIIEIILGVIFILRCFIKQSFKKTIKDFFKKKYKYNKFYNNQNVRLSFAYLIRIRIGNTYLLVKNKKRDIYQPVGGVYHFTDFRSAYRKLKCYRDFSPGDDEDIRVIIKGKYIRRFIRWFNKKQDREISPEREFREELLEDGKFPEDIFQTPKFEFVHSYYKGVEMSQAYNVLELLRFDIFELVPSKEQIEFFNSFKNCKYIKLATLNEIKTLGVTDFNDKIIFGTQTPYILEEVIENE